MPLSPRAAQSADSMLTNIPRLMTAYYARQPDPRLPQQRVAYTGRTGARKRQSVKRW